MSADTSALLTMQGIGAAYDIVLGDEGALRYVDVEGVIVVALDVDVDAVRHVVRIGEGAVVLGPEGSDARTLAMPYARLVAAIRSLDPEGEVRLAEGVDIDAAELVAVVGMLTPPAWTEVLVWLDAVGAGPAELQFADGILRAQGDRTLITFAWLARGHEPLTLDAPTATVAAALARAVTMDTDTPRLAWSGHFAASPAEIASGGLAAGKPVAAVDVEALGGVLLQLLITDESVTLVGRSQAAELTCGVAHDEAVAALIAAVAGARPSFEPLTFRVRSAAGEQESPMIGGVEAAAVWLTETFDRLADDAGDEDSAG